MDTMELEEEKGIDLSEMPMCVRCGLEVANRTEHEAWHQGQQGRLDDLQAQIDGLTQSLASILANQPPAPMVVPNQWVDPKTFISEEQVQKYGYPKAKPQKMHQNPYTAKPHYKSGEKWDKL